MSVSWVFGEFIRADVYARKSLFIKFVRNTSLIYAECTFAGSYTSEKFDWIDRVSGEV